MEADEHLIKFQGALLSLSKRGLLNKPPDEGSAEQCTNLNNVAEEISNFISKLPSSTKCKLTFYMVLNSKLRISNDLKNDESIGLFVNITPPIDLQMLMKWIDVLGLFIEFCEVIKNSPNTVGEELVIAAVNNSKFLSDADFCFPLWSSVFKMICQLENEYSSQSPVTLITCFETICQKVEECLNLNSVTYKNLSLLQDFITTVLDLVSYHKNFEPDDEIFELSIDGRVSLGDKTQNFGAINFVLNTAYNILKTVNFDIWNGSSYVEEWETIRILTSKLLEKVMPLFISNDLVNILSKLALKEMHRSIESLILDVQNGQKNDWIRRMINPRVTECSESPLDEMTDDDLDILLHKVFDLLETSGEEMKELFLAGVIASHNQQKWLEIVFQKYKPNLLTTSNTNKDVIEIFNRISNMEIMKLKVIPLCMQSPVITIKRLCELSISTKADNVHIFHLLKPACRVMLQNNISLFDYVILCLLSEELAIAEEDSFIRFVVQLTKENLLSCEFLRNLIKKLKEFLEKNELERAILCLTVMDSILDDTVNKIAFLVFMSQVLGYFSWDSVSFSTSKANGRDVVFSVVSKLMAKVDCNTDGEILNQARNEIVKSSEVNQACFCDLWFRFGKIWQGCGKFDSIILTLIYSSSCQDIRKYLETFGPPEEVRPSIILTLTKILPVLALKLWRKILSQITQIWIKMNPSGSNPSNEVFQIFITSWYLLTLQLNKDNDMHACYKHCLAGFGKLFLCARLEGESLLLTYEKILFIMKTIKSEEIRMSCMAILLPALKNRIGSVDEVTGSHLNRIKVIMKNLSEGFKN